jgi:flagellar basal body-associated protein FliL
MQYLIKWMMQPQRKNRPQSVDDIQKKLADMPNVGTATVVSNTKGAKSGDAKPANRSGARVDGNNGSIATTLSSGNNHEPKVKSGGSAWKIIVPLIVVALLGAGAYFLFFNKSELQKRAEAHQEEYQEMVEDCDRLISKADDGEDFEEIKKMLVNIEDMEDVYAKALPDVYNMSDELKSQLKEKSREMKRQFMSRASDAFDDDDYRTAYENYKLAADMDPDDNDLTSKLNYISSLLGYIYVTDLDFSNSEADGTDIDEAGTTLYASRMRYLWPRITYTSLLDEGDSSQKIEYYVKIFDPRGNLEHGTNSPAGYTYKGEYTVEPDEVGYKKWLRGWGNAEQSNFETGTYRFEMWHDGGLVYKGSVTLH